MAICFMDGFDLYEGTGVGAGEIAGRYDAFKYVAGLDPASPAGDETVVIVGKNAEFFIIDDVARFIMSSGDPHFPDIEEGRRFFPIGDVEVEGTLTTEFRDEEMLKALLNSKSATLTENQPLYPNRKQRRIADANERRKPRGQRKRMILDIETYDPNRTKDWLHG